LQLGKTVLSRVRDVFFEQVVRHALGGILSLFRDQDVPQLLQNARFILVAELRMVLDVRVDHEGCLS